MSLFDDIDNEVLGTSTNNVKNVQNNSLFADIDNEIEAEEQRQNSFSYKHPIVSSIPEAFKQFGTRAVKSYPDFAKGVNDAVILSNELNKRYGRHIPLATPTGMLSTLASFNSDNINELAKNNYNYWDSISNNIQIDPRYQGLKGLSSKETFLPTLFGEVGGQATNLAMSGGGAGVGAKIAGQMGAKALGKAVLTGAGATIPNLAQEGQYLDKIEQFKKVYGRIPTDEELAQIQNVVFGEKMVNSGLETVADLMLFGKLFPQGNTTNGIKNILKNAGEQAITEAGTEGMQEGVSIGAEKLLGINQGNNLERLAESMAVGGLTGGVIGGGATAISQPYDINFPQGEMPQFAKDIYENSKKTAKDLSNYAKNVSAEIVNRLNPQNYETTVNMQPQDVGVGLSQRTEYVPKGYKRTYVNPNAQTSEAQTDYNNVGNLPSNLPSQLPSNLPLITDNGTGFVLGESGDLSTIAPKTVAKQQAKANKPLQLTDSLSNNKSEATSKPNKASFEEKGINTSSKEKTSKIAPKTAEKQNLSSEQQKQLEEAKQEYEKTKNNITKEQKLSGSAYSDMQSKLKGLAMEYSAKKRQIIQGDSLEYVEGGLTAKELEAKKKHAESNYVGKKVYVNNQEAEIIGHSFGKPKVKFANGEVKTVNKEEVKATQPLTNIDEKIEKIAPKTAEKQAKNNEEKEAKEIAYTLLSMATGKGKEYIKTTLNNSSKNLSMQKKSEALYNLLDNAGDKLDTQSLDPEWKKYFQFDKESSDSITESLVNQALDIIENGYSGSIEKYEENQTKEAEYVENLINEIKNKINNAKSVEELWEIYDNIENELPKNYQLEEIYSDILESVNENATRIEEQEKRNVLRGDKEAPQLNIERVETSNVKVDKRSVEQEKIQQIAPKISKKQELAEKVEKAKKQIRNNIFIPDEQKQVLLELLNGEEKEHFIKVAQELEDTINNAPEFYETDGIDLNDKKPILHYFVGSYDNYVFEIDKKTGELFGAVSFDGYEYELGYSSMEELNSFKSRFLGKEDNYYFLRPSVELDLYLDEDKTFGEITGRKNTQNGYYINKEENENGYNESTILQQQDLARKEQEVNGKSEEIERGKSETLSSNTGIGRENINDLGTRGNLIEEHKAVIETKYKNAHELNVAIENFIKNKEYEKYEVLPEEVKEWLKKYTGAGGKEKQGATGRGLLDEYYTPKNIVKKMWDLTAQYIDTNGAKVLEPSVGIGRFLEYAPENTTFDVVEMNPISAKITELLYPEANITVGQFQEKFIKNNAPVKSVTPEYDIVVGNPPYGEYSGTYKGMGEGKGIDRIETYFIKRSLDTLKENGILTFIVPSGFLDGKVSVAKQQIGQMAELLDAYRLPENTFDTTSIGTDIIVMRKTKPQQGQAGVLNVGRWFEQHPEKILGEVLERKNRFGKEEKYVKGDKNAIESIDTSKKDIKETIKTVSENKKSEVAKATKKKAKKEETKKAKVEYTAYEPKVTIPQSEMKYFVDTRVDGTLPQDKYQPDENVNKFDGELYNDFNYLQGNIYEKLEALETENISEEQKERQRKKLLSVLPKEKKIGEFQLTPSSDFARNFKLKFETTNRHGETVSEDTTLDKHYLSYVNKLTESERKGVQVEYIRKYVLGDIIRFPEVSRMNDKNEKSNYRTKQLTRIKQVVDNTFNEFLKENLNEKDKERLQKEWNKNFNNEYTPDYTKMPLLVKDLNSTFNNNKLVMQDVQIEGINFLTNKGVGLLGFEVGVGKTLTGIVATVQNMQMGRCKRPLMLVPKQVSPNWLLEINQLFPNIKINMVDNMSKFDGEIEDGTITIATYQALDNIWYSKETETTLFGALEEVNSISDEQYIRRNEKDRTERAKEQAKDRLLKFIGEAKKSNKEKFKFEELGFDHITIDEAHNFKNLFERADADGQEGNAYTSLTGASSKRAKQLFVACQYILKNNDNRNVFMLTATPFNNSPLEVFNMLSFLAKDKLEKMNLYNVYQFVENYVDIEADWVVDSKNNVVFKQIPVGFKNLQSLQEVIDSCMLIRSAEDAGIVRPNKHTERVVLAPTELQLKEIAKAEAESIGLIYDEETGGFTYEEPEDGAVLKAINKSKSITLSPDIVLKNYKVSPEDFIKNSPKLAYIMKAVESMKKKDPTTSQLIYMPTGVDFFGKIEEYLINKGVYKKGEIAIIKSGVEDDKLYQIVNSFNDPKGEVKLIIGTKKMKEGMNLNKNSSVLYVPYIDWNPTDFQQIVGRIWRRGNKYKDIRVVVPLLQDSSDPFAFQKLDEKINRLNNLMDKGQDYIDVSELSTSDEKLNMITNPDKKAKMYIQLEKDKISSEINELKSWLRTVNDLSNKLKWQKKEVESTKGSIEYYTKKIEDGDTTEWVKLYLENNKKKLKSEEAKLKTIEKQISKLEIDFDGKDKPEHIEKEIEVLEKSIEELDKVGKEKLEEYKKEYEKNKKELKSIDDLIKDFDKKTDELYGFDSEKFVSYSQSYSNVQGTKKLDLQAINDEIGLGTTIKELSIYLPQELREKFKEFNDYKVEDFSDDVDFSTKALHSYSEKTIYINLEAVGKNSYLFVEALTHELRHARQHKTYVELLERRKKGYKLNSQQRNYIRKFEESNRNNKLRQQFENNSYNKQVFDEYKVKTANLTAQETNEYLKKLSLKNRDIIKQYIKNEQEYEKDWREVKAFEDGLNEAKKFRNLHERNIVRRLTKVQRNTPKWLVGTKAQDKTFIDKEYSKQTGRIDYEKYNLKAKDYIREWYSDIEKGRYDVNKTLNSFINITKAIAKEYSTKFGIKVNDKQVREILPFLRERTGLPTKLNRPDLKAIFDKLDGKQKERLTKLADDTSQKFERYYKEYQEVKGVSSESDIENHISHIWELDKKQKSLLTNYFTTSSRFAKNRTIDTLLKGIDGFEVNGETIYFKPKTLDYAEILKITSDTFIKATADVILAEKVKNMEAHEGNGKHKLVLPSHKAPSEWVEFNHPALNKSVYLGGDVDVSIIGKRPVKVHPAIAKTLKTVFETPATSNAFLSGFDKANSLYKQAQLGFSGFHMVALSESMLGNIGIKETVKLLNPKRMYEEIAKGNWGVYKEDTITKQAIEDGLQLGATLDLDRGTVEKLADDITSFVEKIPVVGKFFKFIPKTLGKAQRLNNQILWDYLHNNYKLECYKLYVTQEAERLGRALTKAERREIAQWVNDSFGGQVWENLGIAPSQRRTEQRFLLSPDWLRSTTRQFLAMFSSAKGSRFLNEKAKESDFWKKAKEIAEEWGINSNTEDIEASSLRGRMSKAFWLRALIYSAILYNMMNAFFRYRDKEEYPEYYPKNMTVKDYSLLGNSKGSKTFVFIGRNSDGTERYLRLGKQFREMPEMLEKPLEKLGGKASPMVQIGSQILTGHTASGFKNKNFYGDTYATKDVMKKGWERVGESAKLVGTSFAPFSLNSAFNPYMDVTAWSLLAPVGKGMTKGKGITAFEEAYKKGSKKEIEEIRQALIRNGFNRKEINSIEKRGKSNFLKSQEDNRK